MIEAQCHCGAIRLEIAAAPATLTQCNCSICHRLGVFWAYYPAAELRILAPADGLIAYAWGDKAIAFHHCRICGCTTHWASLTTERRAINARLLAPALIAATPIRRFDGADTWRYVDD